MQSDPERADGLGATSTSANGAREAHWHRVASPSVAPESSSASSRAAVPWPSAPGREKSWREGWRRTSVARKVRAVRPLALVLLLSPACTPAAFAARDQFVADASCPKKQVGVTKLEYVTTPRNPPPEVAASPERAQVFRAHEEERERRNKEASYFVAGGCGEWRVYACEYCAQGETRVDCGATAACSARPRCHVREGAPATVTCTP